MTLAIDTILLYIYFYKPQVNKTVSFMFCRVWFKGISVHDIQWVGMVVTMKVNEIDHSHCQSNPLNVIPLNSISDVPYLSKQDL